MNADKFQQTVVILLAEIWSSSASSCKRPLRGADHVWFVEDCTGGDLISADANNSPVCCVHNGVAVHHINCPNTYICKLKFAKLLYETNSGSAFYQTMKRMCHNAYVYSDE